MLKEYKPGVPKRYLLLVAGIVWMVVACILLIKGSAYIIQKGDHQVVRFIVASLLGGIFFGLLFIRISSKHIERIRSMERIDPCLFSFFNLKAYLLTVLMVGLGIVMRKMSFVSPDMLYTFYISMGIPLFASAVRFFMAFYRYQPGKMEA